MKHLRWMLVLLCALAIAAVPAWSQAVNATLLGTVTDTSGASVPNAKITIVEVSTSASRDGLTNESGNFVFTTLPPGTYTVTVEASGFKKEVRRNIDVIVNSNTRVDTQLTPGAVTETIDVSAAPPMLQTDRADTGAKIESTTIANLPLGTNRNFQSLLNLVPGTTRATFQHSQFFNASSSLQTEVNGQMRQGNSYQIEGIDDNERTGLLQVLVPPLEAIQTVDVSTSNHDAELGRASGAVTNVILKSGSNELHGGLYYFGRNSSLNARNFFDPSVGHLAYNYYGGNVGGHIKKNKLFYFGDILRITDHEANTNLGTIPPSAWRTGDLSAAATQIYDPATGNPDGSGRLPFANNVIPSNRINAISSKILGLIAAPNQAASAAAPANNYFALLPFTKDTTSFDFKMDYNISEKDRLAGRLSFSRPVINQAPIFGTSGGWAQGAFQGTGVQKTYSTGINWDHIFSNSLVGELRIGVAHYHNAAHNSDYGTNASANLGIPGVNLDAWTSGTVGIQIDDGFSNPTVGYTASLPWIRAEANIDIVNTWTKTLSNHTIKWGVDYRRVRDDLLQTQTFSPRGLYYFGANQTSTPGAKTGIANDMASFLLDQPYQLGRDLSVFFPALRAHQFFAFVQDQWQISPKLTINAGVRWELYPPAKPRLAGGFSNYDPVNNQLVIAGIGNNPMNLGMETNYNYFAPRLGLSYRVNDKTVIRSGFGISYTPFPDNTYAYNYPIKQNNQYQAPNSYVSAVLPNGRAATFQEGIPTPTPVVIPTDGIIRNPDKTQSYIVIPQNFRNPHVASWNISLQRALPAHFTLDVAYVGNHGIDTVATYNLNVPTTAAMMGKGNAGRPQNAIGRNADTTQYFAGYSSMYNGLQVKFNRRLASSLTMTTAYTWAKGMSFQTGDDGGLWQYINPRRSYARTDFDRTQNFNQSYVYTLPFGKGQRWLKSGILASTIGGWQLNGLLTLMTGTPMTFGANGGVLNTPGSNQTADQVAPVEILHGINTPAKGGSPWFSRESFAQPNGIVFGNSGRNVLSGPGFFNLDASLFKTFSINEKMKVEFRAESFSITNTPQFSNPATSLTSGTYGYVTGAGGGRNLQVGAKLSF